MTKEALLKFPCEFPIKVVGKANAEFETFVLSVLRAHFPDLQETALQMRPSKDGNFLAITITVQAENKEQLDIVYRELTASKLVLMAL